MELLAGIAGFALCFIYDWNRVFWKKKWMSGFFMIGCLGPVYAGVRFFCYGWQMKYDNRFFWLAGAVICLAGLIYTLFFALPFDSTYRQEADYHKVCRTGIYGVCRHPGIWWFFGCFLCLGGASDSLTIMRDGMILSLINLLYAWYQDKWIFPVEFSDYGDYQKEVSFLLPFKKFHG